MLQRLVDDPVEDVIMRIDHGALERHSKWETQLPARSICHVTL